MITSELRLLPDAPYESYAAYRAAVGEDAVAKARGMAAESVLGEIRRAGLRGRGGAGFPTAHKWQSVASHPCPVRYVVANAAEGEPGTFKDRFLLRKNPYALLEGMLICAHVLSAKAGYIAIKASYQRELERLKRAVEELRGQGLLERFPINIVEGPEEYLFGEEKALLSVIEGLGPLPRPPESPPYEVGLFAMPQRPNPAVVNNVETFSHVPGIVRHGRDAFRKLGSADTPGTILVTLSGDVARPGVYELEAGMTLERIVHEVGGGGKSGRVVGLLPGVSNTLIPHERFATAADFGSLAAIGSGLGSAGFIALGEQTSIPRVTQAVARFLYVESCNQCSACKAGLRIASRALDELFQQHLATPDDPERALFAAKGAPQGNRCYLPVQASILVPHLLTRYRQAFEAQVRDAAHSPPEWSLPKMVDFDEKTRTFHYDPRQRWKQEDWTYLEPSPEAARRRVPAAPPAGSISVRIAPDLAEALHARAEQSDLDIDRQVDAALREWLAKRARD
jgi:NADH:ubiquinone oxidoreductase subunit F (NADH-binding)